MLADPTVPASPSLKDDDPVALAVLGNARSYRAYFTHSLVAIALRVLEPLGKAGLVGPVFDANWGNVLPHQNKARCRNRKKF